MDAKNLPGLAGQHKLPIIKWKTLRLFTERYIYNINDNGQGGHMLEIDIQYLKSLHHYRKSYILCPERKILKT